MKDGRYFGALVYFRQIQRVVSKKRLREPWLKVLRKILEKFLGADSPSSYQQNFSRIKTVSKFGHRLIFSVTNKCSNGLTVFTSSVIPSSLTKVDIGKSWFSSFLVKFDYCTVQSRFSDIKFSDNLWFSDYFSKTIFQFTT